MFITMLNTAVQISMKRKHERVRLVNLERLVAEAGSAAKLARAAHTSESYLSQVRRQLPTRKGTPRGLGDDLAAKLETAMGKPVGWMDEPHDESDTDERLPKRPNAEPGPDIRGLYPLISWVQAGAWNEIAGSFELGNAEDLVPCPISCSSETFVLRVRGASMEPKFHEGDLIFVDPNVEAGNNSYVVVRLEDSNEATFKQLLIDGEHTYLKALNPDWPDRIIRIDRRAVISGVVVFKGELV
jgi:SOS-response transcriptional repressor LexA